MVADVKASIFHLPDISSLSNAQQLQVLDAYGAASKAVFYLWVCGMGSCLLLMVLVKDKGLTREEEKTQPPTPAAQVSDGEKTAVEPHDDSGAEGEQVVQPATEKKAEDSAV